MPHNSLLNFQNNLTFPYLVIDKIYWSLVLLLWSTITVSCCSLEEWVFPPSFTTLLLTIHHWKYQKRIRNLIKSWSYLSPWILHKKFDDGKWYYLTGADWCIFCGLPPYRWQTRMKRKLQEMRILSRHKAALSQNDDITKVLLLLAAELKHLSQRINFDRHINENIDFSDSFVCVQR